MHACRDYLRESARGQRLYYLGGLLTVTIVTLHNHCSPEGRRRRPVNNVREGFSPESNSVRRLKQLKLELSLKRNRKRRMTSVDDKRATLAKLCRNSGRERGNVASCCVGEVDAGTLPRMSCACRSLPSCVAFYSFGLRLHLILFDLVQGQRNSSSKAVILRGTEDINWRDARPSAEFAHSARRR